MGHFVSSPTEREKRDRRNSRGDEKEGRRRILLVMGLNDTSTLVGHHVSSPRDREKIHGYRRDSGGDEREGQGRKEDE